MCEEKVTIDEAFEDIINSWDFRDCHDIIEDYISLEDVRKFICGNLTEDDKFKIYEEVFFGVNNMKHSSEVLEIIEAGLEGDEKKVRAYAKLLMEKLPDGNLKKAINNRLTGEYKNQPTLKAIKIEGKQLHPHRP